MRHDTMPRLVPRTAVLPSPRTTRRPVLVAARTVSVVHSLLVALAILALGVVVTVASAATHANGDGAAPLPIVFVHGQSGSAQQFETQAMRFTSNGYPQALLYAFEYDTSSSVNPLAGLDAFIDAVRTATGAERVYAVGHSRGTTVWTTYLEDASFDGPEKVARYVNIDGRTLPHLPGGVPTIGIWGEWNTADSGYNRRGNTNAQIGPDPADNFYFGTKSHTETATSAEAFAVMYEFLTGHAPATTDVVPEPPGQVTVAGRAVIFPANVGYPGATVEVWRVDPATGHRIASGPQATIPIDASGDFGPLKLNGLKHYEMAVVRPGDPQTIHHFYFEPFSRSDHFVRLNTSLPNQGLEAFVPADAGRTNLVITRQREFWGDQGSASDELRIDGLNIALPNTSPRTGVNLAVFAHDDGLDGATDLDKGELFPFNLLTFLTAVDVATPASPDGSGTVRVSDDPRGSGNVTIVNVPNWPSDRHRITVQFRDDDQDVERFTDPALGPRGR
jgi:pimeloyl-ACP methyl ester carboxylesterase